MISRCDITGNPIGTDTRALGQPCQCTSCKAALIYPCADCGKMRSQDQGGTTFTVCDKCWENREEVDYQ